MGGGVSLEVGLVVVAGCVNYACLTATQVLCCVVLCCVVLAKEVLVGVVA